MPIRSLLLAGVALAAASAAHAQTSRDDDAMPANIIVTAPMEQSEADVLSGTSIVSGAELTRSVKPTIGETLAHQPGVTASRSEEHTSELQSLMRNSYAVFCLKKKKNIQNKKHKEINEQKKHLRKSKTTS